MAKHAHWIGATGNPLRITWPFLVVVGAVFLLAGASMEILSAARAYVGGESLWSKGQKEAVQHLLHYARSRDEGDYRRFKQALAVPLGDRDARIELNRSRPDYARVRQGFLQGRNHPEDLGGMIALYEYFRNISWMRRSIGIWEEADRSIVELADAGERLHRAVRSGRGARDITASIREISTIDDRLTPLEDEFSYTLGEASRDVKRILNVTIAGLTTVLTLLGLLVVSRTLRRVEHAEALALDEKMRAHVTLQSITDAVITTDLGGSVEYLNPAAEKLTGWSEDEARGRPAAQVFPLIDDETRSSLPDPVIRALADGLPVQSAPQAVLVRRDSGELAVAGRAAPLRDHAGSLKGAVLVARDASAERRVAAKLSYQATHDALTGLLNRAEFERRLGLALQNAATGDTSLAALFLDLDQLKTINDTCGHHAGDALLCNVASLLQARLRRHDTLARLGGDEFGVILEGCERDSAVRIAEQLRQAVRELLFNWQQKIFKLSVSIGLVHLTDPHHSPTEVMKNADRACYLAKEKGRNRVQIYDQGEGESPRHRVGQGWISRIRNALAENRLVLYSQEIAALGTLDLNGRHVEILLRMLDEQGTIVPPSAFIPAAERYQLMTTIDRWVISNVLATLAAVGTDIHTCAINLSGASLADRELAGFIEEEFLRRHVPPWLVCFEIAETTAISQRDTVAPFLRRLRTMGCRFALDNVGAGTSSLAGLRDLPMDFVKLDGELVRRMMRDDIDRTIVESVQRLAAVMGIPVIAQSVEDPAAVAQLTRLGIEYAQGFALAHPVRFAATAGTSSSARDAVVPKFQ